MKNKQLDDLKKRLEKYIESIKDLDGQKIDLTKEEIFRSNDTYLHQDTEESTEEKSAAFERDNPILFAYLVALREKISKGI